MDDDQAFLAAICQSPTDEAARLVYADWLEERSDPRAAYVRAEVEHFRKAGEGQATLLESLKKQVDPVWAEMVSRVPYGILIPGLTYSECGPRIDRADIQRIEEHWQAPLPPDYAAFLLCYNGGRPSKPYLYSYADYPEGTEEFFDEVRFFSTADLHSKGRPYLLQSVSEVYAGQVAENADEEQLSRMMPIGTVSREDGIESMVALLIGDDEFLQVTVVTYGSGYGVGDEDSVHQSDCFWGFLADLRDR